MFNNLGNIPKEEEENISYTLYDYLTDDAKKIYINIFLPPKGIDYTTDVNPRFHREHTFSAGGFIQKTILSSWDFDNNLEIDKILEVEETYTLIDDAPYPAQKSVSSREKTRKWQKKDGQLDEVKTKVSKKVYDTTKKRNDEGKRRRTNITQNTAQGCVYSLVVLYYMGSLGQDAATATSNAQEWIAELIHSINSEYNDYIVTGKRLPDAVNTLSNPLLDTQMSITIPDIPEIYGDPYAQRGIGLTVRDYLVESFKGNI